MQTSVAFWHHHVSGLTLTGIVCLATMGHPVNTVASFILVDRKCCGHHQTSVVAEMKNVSYEDILYGKLLFRQKLVTVCPRARNDV